MNLEIQVLALDRYIDVTGLSRLMRFQTYPIDNWMANLS
jgi:hypothetical protein